MYTNKQTALLLERQHLKSVRKYYLSISDINMTLAKLHKDLQRELDLTKYQSATEYIHQYISYTTVWNLKFVANLESPEVALMQIFHLEYIFSKEPANHFQNERAILKQQKETFVDLTIFPPEHIERRFKDMLTYIRQNQ